MGCCQDSYGESQGDLGCNVRGSAAGAAILGLV